MRYKLTPPVEGGYAFWVVADTQDEEMPNREMITIWKNAPCAQDIAVYAARVMNGQEAQER